MFTHYQQLDQMDCGPTCLRMVAKHYGRKFSTQTLRERAQIGKEGVSLLGIAEAAESLGFRTLGAKLSFDKLATEAPLPCIVHWDQHHFVVVYGVEGARGPWMSHIWGGRQVPRYENTIVEDRPLEKFDSPTSYERNPTIYSPVSHSAAPLPKGTVLVADPSRGLLRYSAEEFCKHWLSVQTGTQETGIVLLLEPTPDFYEQQDEITPRYGFGRVLGYLWQYRTLLFQLALGLLVGSGLQLLFPFLTQSVVDVGVNTQNLPFVYLVLGAQLMLMAGRLSVEFLRSWTLLHISTRVNLSILSDFLIKLIRLPLAFFDSKHFGDLMQRVNDHHRIEQFLTSQTLSVLFSLFNLGIFGLVLAVYSLPIFVVFLTGSVLYIGWVALFLNKRRQLDFKRFDVAARSQSNLIQLLQGMADIKLAGAERPMRWAWERLQASQFRLQMRSLRLNQFQQAGAFALNEGKNILITFLSAQAVIHNEMTLGAMLAMQQIVGQLNGPLEQFIVFVQSWQDAKISLERLNEIHTMTDEEPIDQTLPQGLPVEGGPTQPGLSLRGLSYQYPGAGNEPVLRSVSLDIPAGKTTAIVGMSGSGKTTLLKLLLRFYEPQAGEIRLGETPLRYIGHSAWRMHCGVVMQDGFLFSDTLARNIAVGVERVDAARLAHAVEVANLTEFINSLPMGLYTKIGPEGNGLSQGQRQRVLIARAVYKNPQFLFFDEATNALDATNEAAIMHSLDAFLKGRTVVVVAHRLSTVCGADQIVVLDKGRIAETGTHSQLVATRGPYWQLVKNQLELGM